MLGSIIKIIIGLIIWKLIPGWTEYGDRKVREFIQLCCNIIGIIFVIFGVISLFNQFMGLLSF